MPDRHSLGRRRFLRASASAAILATAGKAWPALAESAREIVWEDLIPNPEARMQATMNRRGMVQHGGAPIAPLDDGKDLSTELLGTKIQIGGYIIPLDYNGEGVNELILVPYIGACIHVPPPPPNQLILVRTESPYNPREMFEAVNVSGTLGALSGETELAEVGYSLQADEIAPYR